MSASRIRRAQQGATQTQESGALRQTARPIGNQPTSKSALRHNCAALQVTAHLATKPMPASLWYDTSHPDLSDETQKPQCRKSTPACTSHMRQLSKHMCRRRPLNATLSLHLNTNNGSDRHQLQCSAIQWDRPEQVLNGSVALDASAAPRAVTPCFPSAVSSCFLSTTQSNTLLSNTKVG